MVMGGCHAAAKTRSSTTAPAEKFSGPAHRGASGAAVTTARHTSTQPTTTQTILDVRRGTGSFPLSGAAHDAQSLREALTQGYLLRLTPMSENFVTVTGELPHLKSVHVDVSGAKVHPDYRPARFDKHVIGESSLRVDDLDYEARPLAYENMRMNVHLSARDATMELLRDSKDRRGLVLSGARKGRMDFAISAADSQGLLSVTGRKGGGAAGVEIEETKLSFASDSPHSIEAAVHVRARWLILPMSFRVHAKLAVTDDGTVTYQDVGADGENPGGNLAASFLSPYLKKMNGQTQKMVAFSDEKTRVTSVRFATEDGIQLAVEFGRD
jgi:hypothetical protein